MSVGPEQRSKQTSELCDSRKGGANAEEPREGRYDQSSRLGQGALTQEAGICTFPWLAEVGTFTTEFQFEKLGL